MPSYTVKSSRYGPYSQGQLTMNLVGRKASSVVLIKVTPCRQEDRSTAAIATRSSSSVSSQVLTHCLLFGIFLADRTDLLG